jgi:hypothetical protein
MIWANGAFWCNDSSMAIQTLEPIAPSAPSSLTALDRCDRCNAQAYVRVTLAAGELLFCGHHAREHAPAFGKTALFVQDESHRLTA